MTRYTPERRARAPRMLAEAIPDHPNLWSAVRHVAGLLGMSREALRVWHRRLEVDAGVKPGVPSDAAEEIKRLKREVAELRKANEIGSVGDACDSAPIDTINGLYKAGVCRTDR